MIAPMVSLTIHAEGCEFTIRTSENFKWIRIGSSSDGYSVFATDADLTRLRDVIDAHLSQNTQQEAA